MSTKSTNPHPFWKTGRNYFIRTVTYHLTGRLDAMTDTELVIADAAWIADSGRFTQAVESCEFSEVEPFPKGRAVLVNRASITDAVEIEKLPVHQK